MNHIFVKEGYGPEAICFYEFVFGAKVMSRATETINKNKEAGRLVSSELKFGPNSIIVSERNTDSSMVDKSCASGETRPVIWLTMKDIDPVVARAKKCGIDFKQADMGKVDDWCTVQIMDPYGIIWMIKSLAKIPKQIEIEDK